MWRRASAGFGRLRYPDPMLSLGAPLAITACRHCARSRSSCWLGRRAADSFFPLCCCKATVLQEGVGNHRHQRMAVKALPASTLKVIKADLLFELLMRLLAAPARLDRPGERPERGAGRVIRQVVFLLAPRAPLTHEPRRLPRQVLRVGAE